MSVVTKSEIHKVLFLCTGNSCRSQMAEAITNAKLADTWRAFSAGTKPAGYVHPLAVKILKEIGINHLGRSKDVTQYFDQEFDLVVTVCDSAAEDCPTWLKPDRQIHLSFVDPAKIEGDDEYVLGKFREVRDEIGSKIPQLLGEIRV
jgi:arsenate reductase